MVKLTVKGIKIGTAAVVVGRENEPSPKSGLDWGREGRLQGHMLTPAQSWGLA